MLLRETHINCNRNSIAYSGCAHAEWTQCALNVLWVLVSKEAESQKITLLSSRAVRGISEDAVERGIRAGVRGASAVGGTVHLRPEGWISPAKLSEGCFRRGSSGDSEMWEDDWAHLARPLTACTLGKNQALDINSHEEEPRHIQCQSFGRPSLWVLRKKQPQRAASMSGNHTFLWSDLDIQGDTWGEAQVEAAGPCSSCPRVLLPKGPQYLLPPFCKKEQCQEGPWSPTALWSENGHRPRLPYCSEIFLKAGQEQERNKQRSSHHGCGYSQWSWR